LAKLHFYYSAMNAGKSTTLLQSAYNYHERGMDTIVFLSAVDTRAGGGIISTRIGLERNAVNVDKDFNMFEYAKEALQKNSNIQCVLVDEAQFLNKKQIEQLCDITDKLNVPVLAYGLRTDYMGEPFEASKYLLAWADILIELKTICHCGRKATMNLRVDEKGKAVREGDQVCIGGNDSYVATCRKHFKAGEGLYRKHLEQDH